MSELKLFPMQKGPPIPWAIAEKIYEVYANLYGNEQTIERLAERGGFGWAEITHLHNEYKRKHGKYPDWSITNISQHFVEQACSIMNAAREPVETYADEMKDYGITIAIEALKDEFKKGLDDE